MHVFLLFFGRCAAGREPSFPDEKSSGAGGGRTSDENQDLGTNRANVVTNKGSTRNHVIAPRILLPFPVVHLINQGALPCSCLLSMPITNSSDAFIKITNTGTPSLAHCINQYFSTKFVFRLYLQQLAFAQAKLGLRFFPR